MANKKLYIISYDLDSDSPKSRSKRLIQYLKEEMNAIPLTKSTWLVSVTYGDAGTLATELDTAKSEWSDLDFGINEGYRDRIFVAEITGRVFYDNVIYEDDGKKSLSRIFQQTENVKDIFD